MYELADRELHELRSWYFERELTTDAGAQGDQQRFAAWIQQTVRVRSDPRWAPGYRNQNPEKVRQRRA